MKLRKAEIWIAAVTAAFTLVTAAYHVGKNADRAPVHIEPSALSERAVPAVAAEEESAVNINTATAEELRALQGVGDVLSERIVAYREENGPFQSVTEITNVRGIGAAIYEANRGRMTIGEGGTEH